MLKIAFLSAAHTHTKGFLNAARDHEKCETAVIWDDVSDRGQRFADEYETEYSGDLDAVIARDDIDGFIICAENTRHLPLLEAAVPAGKPIFCEKPFTTTTADAEKAVALIKEHGTIVHMGYFTPFTAESQGVIEILDAGTLGNVTHARMRNAHHAAYGHWFDSSDLAWFYNPELSGGGAFMDMGTHAVHFVRTLFGPAKRVFSHINNVSGIYTEVDDNGIALVEFESGCLCTVEAAWTQTGGLSGLEVTGSEATLFNLPGKGYVYASPGKEQVSVPAGTEKPTRVDRLVAAIEGTLSRDELDADLECAVDAVRIMEACYKSNEAGTWVDV
ncbi:MAG: Gfo/Idh/MocA family oxidoreductase [Planctomycetota bacterium]|jgi:predicted dehydrogenase|nr:Gfo/Idh/MocA family oxidoreductase [Planctomycetota bacterium]